MKYFRVGRSLTMMLPLAATAAFACTYDVLLPDGPDTTSPDDLDGAPVSPDPGPPPAAQADKADILFVVDNSVSMADKQELFELAVPRLVHQLAEPPCRDDSGETHPSNDDGSCPEGTSRERAPLRDVHFGVITSSIGGQGSSSCQPPEQDDKAHLLPTVRSIPDPSGKGFVTYDGDVSKLPTVSATVAEQIVAAGERGCGFEAPLEAMYRFLIDPAPPRSIVLDDLNQSRSSGIDEELLTQRAAFLRDDSAVIVVLLSDEDDCSVMTGATHYENAGFGWLTTEVDQIRFAGFPTPSPTCAEDPDDACCHSTLQAEVPEGCDPFFAPDSPPPLLAPDEDRPNLRCHDQKRRFGIDLLFPVERYVAGLSEPYIRSGPEGNVVANPLFLDQAGKWKRNPKQVFFSTLAGVPWQDLATDTTIEGSDLVTYLSPEELSQPTVDIDGKMVSRWDLIVGKNGQTPFDPFMVASIAPREGEHPLTGSRIIPLSGSGANAINGHEYNNAIPGTDGLPSNDDLQYACIFPLAPLDAVKDDCMPDTDDCDCGLEPDKNRPLCKSSLDAEAPATNTQFYGKAYPSHRILQVARDLGSQGVPASICAAKLEPRFPDYGYNPAVDSLMVQIKSVLPPSGNL